MNRRLAFVFVTGNFGVGALVAYVFACLAPDALRSMGDTGVGAGPQDAMHRLAWFGSAWFVLCAGALIWGRRTDLEIAKWHARLVNGSDPAEVPLRVRHHVLTRAVSLSLASLLSWLTASVVFGLGVCRSLTAVVLIGGVAGPPSASLMLPLADLVWRPVIPVFFPDGRVSDLGAFRFPVAGRLLLAFFVVSLYPTGLLAATSLNRATALCDSPDPQTVLGTMITLQAVLVATSALLSVTMAMAVTRSVVDPVGELQRAMTRVAGDDLDVGVPVTANDELGYVGEVFNDMVGRLREGRLVRGLLDQYVSPEVARRAVESQGDLEGRVVHCSVLFADMREFTALSQRLSPMELMRTMNAFVGAMISVVADHGGIVNKLGGDSLLALFGTPLNPMEDSESQAVRAGLAMQRRLTTLNGQQEIAGCPALRMGIGIASGPAVAGNVGTDERMEYTVVGEAVNRAARLEEVTKRTGTSIFIDEATHSALHADLQQVCDPVPATSLRGFAQPLVCYSIP